VKITLIPQRRDEVLTLVKTGDVLSFNGESFDFSGVPDGATLPRRAVNCGWLASDIERKDGCLHLAVILPHGAGASEDLLFPAAIEIEEDGLIHLPTETEEVSDV
jgi:hypothetical protein